MSGFHSTVTRRDFMKGLGITGVGLGAAGLVAPAFHDLDELMSSTTATVKRPWWVKEREHDHPTTEVDWTMLKRYDHKLVAPNKVTTEAFGAAEVAKMDAAGRALRDRDQYKVAGHMLRDVALQAGAGGGPKVSEARNDWGGPKSTQTPEVRGVPKWTGSPEEANAMLRAAMRFFGAAAITVGDLNGNHRNLINASDRSRDIVIETLPDGDEGGLRNNKYVIPDKPLWEIGWQSPHARDAYTTGQSQIWRSSNGARYTRRSIVQPATQEFMRALGYICIAGIGYPITSGAGNACLHGGAENSRATNATISPEYGPCHGYFELITDLEMAPEQPIDAGIWRFCHTCGRCADYCPSDSITHDREPTWEVPRSKLAPNVAMTGHVWKKSFFPDRISCNKYNRESITASTFGCHICAQVCVFNQGQGAIAHQVSKSVISTTGIFNRAFFHMGEFFGYGNRDPEEWWDLSLPQFGIDTTTYAKDGGF